MCVTIELNETGDSGDRGLHDALPGRRNLELGRTPSTILEFLLEDASTQQHSSYRLFEVKFVHS